LHVASLKANTFDAVLTRAQENIARQNNNSVSALESGLGWDPKLGNV
jgi:hypothetical protein